MKFIFILLLPLVLRTTIYGQFISYDDFKTVIPYLQKEDFKSAFKKTAILLNSTQNDSSDLRGIVTYINIFSAAGMVTLNQMTFYEFSKNVNKYIGQWIVMSAHPCIDSSKHGFNSLVFGMLDGVMQGSIASSNNAETHILCFEYFKYAEPINPLEFIGKKVRCGGVLESFEVNPNKSKIWVARLHILNAFARVVMPK